MKVPPAPLLDREARKQAIRDWLDSDPELREEFIHLSPELTALAARVAKWDRLAVGLSERTARA